MDIADAAAACAGHKKGKLCREGGVLQGVPRGDDAYTGGKVVLIPAMAPGATGATGATGASRARPGFVRPRGNGFRLGQLQDDWRSN